MDLFTPEFWSTLFSIVVIDLVLAGDNAIVIGLAARNLPKAQQKRVIFWGTLGAIVIRSILTLVVVWLLRIPGLLILGGLLLIWIAYKLLAEEKEHEVKTAANVYAAIWTIIVADTAMGLDNVLAVAGAAHGNFLMVVLGLIISVPIVVWGSTIILRWVDRFPIIIFVGSGVLAWTAGKMIVEEPLVEEFFVEHPFIRWGVILVLIGGVLLAGWMQKKRAGRKKKQQQAQ
ncbi:TerC family protein [Paenibacillus xerothermodurans]|uniref:TerC family protein n=1 Tax=Paenibacillus xerothermodurans TaxID=1977292 RepID=A0A2W1NDK0_PAEXE|nr:TerC family protein [Paenibacillus xerothermodurans]PZE22779.1 TerC family protein [Paenibacillus xerothermodurans]